MIQCDSTYVFAKQSAGICRNEADSQHDDPDAEESVPDVKLEFLVTRLRWLHYF